VASVADTASLNNLFTNHLGYGTIKWRCQAFPEYYLYLRECNFNKILIFDGFNT